MSSDAQHMDWKPSHNPWLIAIVVALAAFMEVLDTSIANVALPHISGNLGASPSQGTWVLTTYLVSNAIVLPITGWITSIVGRKRFFLICIGIFTAASFLCGIAPSFPLLLVARAIQGAGGGGMQPMAQAIMADSFPPRQRGLAFALFGVTAVVAPALGPILGGWITDNFTWRWIFLINLPVGFLAFSLISQLVEDPPFLKRLRSRAMRLDYIGFSALILGVGALQIMLDKGHDEDWFNSRLICTLGIVAVVFLVLLVLWDWYEKHPIVDVRLFKVFNFASASTMMFIAGVTSFAAGVIMPQFLQIFMGYQAQTAGLVVSAGAAILLVVMPVVGFLTAHVPVKFLMAAGWASSAAALFYSAHVLSMNLTFGRAALLMVLQFAPIGLIFVPAVTVSYIGVPRDRSDSVSGLSNFMRNIGSSVGTSLIQSTIAQRAQFHTARLAEHATLADPGFINQVMGLSSAMQMQGAAAGSQEGQMSALTRLYQFISAQAWTLSYIDVYYLMGAASAVMVLLSLFLKANDPKHTEEHAAH